MLKNDWNFVTGIAPYEPPPGAPFKVDIHGFWLVPDPLSPSGHRAVPIPDEQFSAYLLSLED